MLQQVGNPFRVLHIRFATSDRLNMLGIGHNQFKEAFQAPIDVQPVDPGALHAHMGDAVDREGAGSRWVGIPHMRQDFYVRTYACGMITSFVGWWTSLYTALVTAYGMGRYYVRNKHALGWFE